MSKRVKGLVSVVISNYNNGRYLRKCLDSLTSQTYKNIEIIVVDDGSSDNSVEVLNEWKKNNVSITILALPRNIGFAGAVSSGLFIANGEFIAMQDSDDISEKTRIQVELDYLNKNPKISAVGSNYAIFNDSEKEAKLEPNGIKYGIDEIKETYSLGGNCVCYGTLLIRGEVFDQIGGLSRRIEGAEDYEFITKLLPYGVDNITEVLYYYRRHREQRSINFYGMGNNEKLSKDELRVLLVLDSFNLGGTETHIYALAKELMEENIKVSILSGEGPLEDKFKGLGCKIHNMEFPVNVTKDRLVVDRYIERISRVIQADDINVIHAHQSPSGSLAIETAKELNIPSIFTVHGLYYQDMVSDKLPQCNKLISVSIPVYEWLLKFNIQSRVIANGVEFINSNYEINRDIRKELNIPKDAMTILYCSRLAWGKARSCENLLRACRDLRRLEQFNIHVLVVGEGPELSRIRVNAERANSVIGTKFIHMIGGQTELREYYNAADCVVGTGRVAIEAMSVQKPVIATGNDGYFGILTEENFKEGWKVYFGDHKSKKINNATFVYEDLKYMYNNLELHKKKAIALCKLAKEMFDSKIIVKELIDEYLSLFK